MQKTMTLMKEFKYDTNRCSDVMYLIVRINFLKMSILPNNLQIQCNTYQVTNSMFHRTKRKIFTICVEIQRTLNSQSYLEKEEWNWGNQPP